MSAYNQIKVDCRARNYKERSQKGRVYVFVEGETLIENLEKRHDRPYKFYKQHIIPAVVRHLQAAGEDVSRAKFAWSQTAGCSCGCSPGFIVDGGLAGREVFVTVEG